MPKYEEAERILEGYNGSNRYILALKRDDEPLDKFKSEYIINSHDMVPVKVGKIVKLARWYAISKMADWGLETLSDKIFVDEVMGHTSAFYHVRAMYRQSVGYVNMFIPKSAIIGDLLQNSTPEPTVDFDYYDSICSNKEIKLKEHQKEGVKFLLKKKWAILGDDMGLGKTIELIITALASGCKKILVICPASLKNNWKKEISRYTDESNVEIVNGSKWKENMFTVINYDILDNFYEVPMEPAYETVTFTRDGKVVTEKVQKFKTVKKVNPETGVKESVKEPVYKVSKKKADILKAMENSQLFKSSFDMVIIDECHKLSNSTSGRYAVVSDLIKRLSPEYVIPVTGTLITNYPENFYNILKLINHPVTWNWDYYMERYCGSTTIPQKGEWERLYAIWKSKVGTDKDYLHLNPQGKNNFKTFFEANKKYITIRGEASNLDELMECTKDCYIRRMNANMGSLPPKELVIKEYDLNADERSEYNRKYKEYVSEKQRINPEYTPTASDLIEMVVLRMYTANKMVSRTIKLADEHISKGEKVVIICCFDSEIEALSEYYGKKCVVFNGKMSLTKKDDAKDKFTYDDSVMVFIGNINSCGVGITLVASHICIFNSMSFVPADMLQAQDRVYRIGQKHPVTVYYQLFKDTVSSDTYEKILEKQLTISTVIRDESHKS